MTALESRLSFPSFQKQLTFDDDAVCSHPLLLTHMTFSALNRVMRVRFPDSLPGFV